MSFASLARVALLFSALATTAKAAGMPDKIYGVNLGSWLLIEPWMLPEEWASMGGENSCSDGECWKCIKSEYALVEAYPDTADARFAKHWNTWFNQTDVDELVAAGINTVRIPLGYWIVEPLVDRKTEFYPKGGILELQRGLQQLKNAGIAVILDHHALPGVQTPNQMFAGRCTDQVEFYTPYNYRRALIWSGIMTALSHLDPAWSNVFSIHAINEVMQDASKTPGYGEFQRDFVQIVRAVEMGLGIFSPLDYSSGGVPSELLVAASVESAMATVSVKFPKFSAQVRRSLVEMVPVFVQVAKQLAVNTNFNVRGLRSHLKQRQPLYTNFMDVTWQYLNNHLAPNAADVAIGPQAYDNHLYYFFGGITDPEPEAYLKHMCNLNRLETAVANRNTPLWFGEWSLGTQFQATDEFMRKWADAQKLIYGRSQGWLFWNWKIETSTPLARQWSYKEALRLGYFTQDPSQYNDPNVCDPYVNVPGNTTSTIPEPTSVAPEPTSDAPQTTSVVLDPTSVTPEPTTDAPEPTSAAPDNTTTTA
ncbi:glycoside hydrolase family 5 protein [Coprinopsis sp. MPI-PUGE-AT-0042]|nr:glycoside hydrolase family 5 protein [Coprinopsis sp. MPI-PUGE-AT-0042]